MTAFWNADVRTKFNLETIRDGGMSTSLQQTMRTGLLHQAAGRERNSYLSPAEEVGFVRRKRHDCGEIDADDSLSFDLIPVGERAPKPILSSVSA